MPDLLPQAAALLRGAGETASGGVSLLGDQERLRAQELENQKKRVTDSVMSGMDAAEKERQIKLQESGALARTKEEQAGETQREEIRQFITMTPELIAGADKVAPTSGFAKAFKPGQKVDARVYSALLSMGARQELMKDTVVDIVDANGKHIKGVLQYDQNGKPFVAPVGRAYEKPQKPAKDESSKDADRLQKELDAQVAKLQNYLHPTGKGKPGTIPKEGEIPVIGGKLPFGLGKLTPEQEGVRSNLRQQARAIESTLKNLNKRRQDSGEAPTVLDPEMESFLKEALGSQGTTPPPAAGKMIKVKNSAGKEFNILESNLPAARKKDPGLTVE